MVLKSQNKNLSIIHQLLSGVESVTPSAETGDSFLMVMRYDSPTGAVVVEVS